jgi:SHS2 domain-containing protein
MKNFEVLDISGDVGLKAYGKDLIDSFINAAIGMYSLITDLEMIKEHKSIDVSVKSDSVEGLLVSWLNELIFHFDTYGLVGKKIVMAEFTPSLTLPTRGTEMGESEICRLKASVSGEEFDSKRHESKLLIKAATYHRLKVEKTDDLWEINVIFDI